MRPLPAILASLVVLTGSSAAAHREPAATLKARTWEWRQAATLGGTPTWFSAAFTIGDMAYVASGYGFGTAFWRYDPGRDTWTRKADFAGKARGAAVAFSIGGKGYVGLGYSDGDRFADLWEYDPIADRWMAKAPLPATARDHARAFVIGRKAYVVGGMTCTGNDCTDLEEVWEYDPQPDRWRKKADLPGKATNPACFVLDDKAYLATGYWDGVPAKDLWEYDPKADHWTRKAGFPGPGRFRAIGFARRRPPSYSRISGNTPRRPTPGRKRPVSPDRRAERPCRSWSVHGSSSARAWIPAAGFCATSGRPARPRQGDEGPAVDRARGCDANPGNGSWSRRRFRRCRLAVRERSGLGSKLVPFPTPR
jgi:N-acetylneuraminic acid mutarotase